MKFVIVFVALFAVAFAAPADSDAQVLRFDSDVKADGFNYAYETSNGIKEDASAVLNNVGSENEAIAVRGSYSFVADDGVTYTVNYIADENGFQPQGAHLPVAPEA
ncbi:PREDICTED: larval cuticle protein 8-like [Rhagoletis zephyria]|uniref:larval cuticle protein 8-like n=1 Tax=Rhagoletis zephyria TaxID=28612 RepID=UPI0008113324|nr:PREDICTED: larval cuticle protein 8-like [Rhagoletis zephyria]